MSVKGCAAARLALDTIVIMELAKGQKTIFNIPQNIENTMHRARATNMRVLYAMIDITYN